MVPHTSSSGHSAVVRMTLQMGDISLPVAQLGPDFLVLEAAVEHPPATGIVTLEVDGRVRTVPVHIPGGLYRHSEEVFISRASSTV